MLYENESFQLNPEKMPKHVAIIMDGNGRWATKRGLPRKAGHKAGAEALERIIYAAKELGLEHLTVYAFSTENWKRSAEEVGALMQLFRFYLKRLLKIAKKNNVRVKMIGDSTRFDSDIIEGINRLEDETAANTGMTFVIAVNYGGRDEIKHATQEIAKQVQAGTLSPDDITEQTIADHLYTAGLPDVDLLLRPSGELRLSNYLLWQCAYSELYFCDTYWPDFSNEDLHRAIADYQHRQRRFGKTGEQVKEEGI